MTAPFLEGKRLYLRGLSLEDAEGAYPEWLNDEEVCRGNGHHLFPYGREQAREFIRGTWNDRSAVTLAMVLREGHRHIGNVALQGIHQIHRTAEFAILLGDRESWGQGYGREAGLLLCRHGFRALQLHRVGCGTFADNEGMRGLARALGMKEEGRRRQAVWKDGRYVDVVEFGVLAEEFFERFGGGVPEE